MQISPDQEKYIIQMLNRNIKYEKESKKDEKKDQGFVDIDEYFSNLINDKIKKKETLDMKKPPKEFDQIVKNHYYHLTNDEFDKKEFNFCLKMLHMKSREGIEDSKKNGLKYVAPDSTAFEENQFNNEAEVRIIFMIKVYFMLQFSL